MWFLENAYLVPLVPVAAFVIILLFGKRMPRHGSTIGILALATSWVLSVGTLIQWIQRIDDAEEGHSGALGLIGSIGRSVARPLAEEHAAPIVEPVTKSFTWFQNGGIRLGAGMQIDGLSVILLFIVCTVSLLVHVYSTEYMRGDRRYTHYFAFLSMFTASMLTLVIADNTLMLMIGWELVGMCSFVLIGHWWEEQPNSNAALKAFLTTRTGDVGLMIGVIILFSQTGTFNIVETNASALGGGISHGMLLAASVALLIGIMGKSGQFPLHTWLPDAMAGPTPVSALIHAATMVVAGVYLGARLYGVFWEGFSIGNGGINMMAAVGGITLLIGALLAFVQDDIKKVLAYSTISQLGYMVMALGVGAWTAAVFHLFTHAFFKALLFLGAGSVSHSGAHHSFDMKKDMGGLRKYMPQTFWTFIIGTLALAGVFPFAGFFSKDEILAGAGQGGFRLFFWVGLVGAFLTATYMGRCVWLTFFGEYRGGAHAPDLSDPETAAIEHQEEEEAQVGHFVPGFGPDAHDDHGHTPHESNRTITVPLWILSFFTITVGLLQAPIFHIEKFKDWFEPRVSFPIEEIFHPEVEWWMILIALAAGVGGLFVAYLYYARDLGPHDLAERNSVARAGKTFLVNKYYLDVLYTDIIVGSIKGPIARAVYWFNQHVIDNVLNYTGKGAVGAANAVYEYFDQRTLDRSYDGIATGTGDAGGATQRLQTGRLQWYALMLVAGVLVIALALVIAN